LPALPTAPHKIWRKALFCCCLRSPRNKLLFPFSAYSCRDHTRVRYQTTLAATEAWPQLTNCADSLTTRCLSRTRKKNLRISAHDAPTTVSRPLSSQLDNSELWTLPNSPVQVACAGAA